MRLATSLTPGLWPIRGCVLLYTASLTEQSSTAETCGRQGNALAGLAEFVYKSSIIVFDVFICKTDPLSLPCLLTQVLCVFGVLIYYMHVLLSLLCSVQVDLSKYENVVVFGVEEMVPVPACSDDLIAISSTMASVSIYSTCKVHMGPYVLSSYDNNTSFMLHSY